MTTFYRPTGGETAARRRRGSLRFFAALVAVGAVVITAGGVPNADAELSLAHQTIHHHRGAMPSRAVLPVVALQP